MNNWWGTQQKKLARLTIRQVRVSSMSFSTYAKFWTKLNDVYGIFKEKNLIHLEFVFAQYELNIIRFMVWNPVTWVPSFYLLYHESYISSKFRGETICPSLYRAANSLSSIFFAVAWKCVVFVSRENVDKMSKKCRPILFRASTIVTCIFQIELGSYAINRSRWLQKYWAGSLGRK